MWLIQPDILDKSSLWILVIEKYKFSSYAGVVVYQTEFLVEDTIGNAV